MRRIWLLPAVLGRAAITQPPSVRGRQELVDLGKFCPVSAQASPLQRVTHLPRPMLTVIINETIEKGKQACSDERVKSSLGPGPGHS